MSSYFEHIYLESGIHRIKWLSRSGDSAQAYFEFIVDLYTNLPDNTEEIRILHDYQHILFLPTGNILPQMKTLQSMYPNLKRKIAYLSDAESIETLMNSIVDVTQRSGDRKFFKPNQEHLAIEWLLSDNL